MKIIYFILAFLLVLTVASADEGNTSAPTISLSQRDIDCMKRNIFYEAGAEPIEGKVAVAMVTLNRTQDPNFPRDVCGVIKQKTVYSVPKNTTTTKTVKTGWFTPDRVVTEVNTSWIQRAVCQFSWVCGTRIKIKNDDPRWIESQEVVERLLSGDFLEYREKYENAKHFHAVFVNPHWNLKQIARIGRHIFYE
jgi:spore germination cell wall hydrolase CwlJ-like protein